MAPSDDDEYLYDDEAKAQPDKAKTEVKEEGKHEDLSDSGSDSDASSDDFELIVTGDGQTALIQMTDEGKKEIKDAPVSVSAEGGLDINKVATFQGKPLTQLDLESLKDKPWRLPGADITDYFNYGFNEVTWIAYCSKQDDLRAKFPGFPAGFPPNFPGFPGGFPPNFPGFPPGMMGMMNQNNRMQRPQVDQSQQQQSQHQQQPQQQQYQPQQYQQQQYQQPQQQQPLEEEAPLKENPNLPKPPTGEAEEEEPDSALGQENYEDREGGEDSRGRGRGRGVRGGRVRKVFRGRK